MTDTDYEILSFLSRRPSCLWSEVLNAFDPVSKINEVNGILFDFLDCGWIEKRYPAESPPRCRIRISRKGLRALRQVQVAHPTESSRSDSTCDPGKKDVPTEKNRFSKLKKFFSALAGIIAVLASLATVLAFLFQLLGVF